MNVVTPFDAALAELLRAWRRRDDLRQQDGADDAAIRAAFVDLDRARQWVRTARTATVWRFERRDDPRDWLPSPTEALVREVTQRFHGLQARGIHGLISSLLDQAEAVHTRQCVNLDPSRNVMSPRARQALAVGLGTPPGQRDLEMGTRSVGRVEVMATELAAQAFAADFVEIRTTSGSMALMAGLRATTRPGDPIIVEHAGLGGHPGNEGSGAAAVYGLDVHRAPVGVDRVSIDVNALARMASVIRPQAIILGGGRTARRHPVAAVRKVADEVDATVLVDVGHLGGLIAGGAWPNPLVDGAHLMTLDTAESLAGPLGGMVLTRDPAIARRVDEVMTNGLAATIGAGQAAALAVTLLDWIEHGRRYAGDMVATARVLGDALADCGLPVVRTPGHQSPSHQFSLDASAFGHAAVGAGHLRRANLLTAVVELPGDVDADHATGLVIGTPEILRWGISQDALPQLASFIAQAWQAEDPSRLAATVARFRCDFRQIHYVC